MHRAVEDLEFTLPECGNQRSSRLRMHCGSSPAVKAKAAELAASRRGTGADAAWVDPREVLSQLRSLSGINAPITRVLATEKAKLGLRSSSQPLNVV